MAGHCVLVCVLVLVVGGETTTTSAPTPHITPQGENCQGDAVTSLRQSAGCSPACVASSLSLCSQIQEQNQLSAFVEEVRDMIRQVKPPTRGARGHNIVEEGDTIRPRHCQEILEEGDSGRGVRLVYPYYGRPDDAAAVFCDHTVDGGGWTVIQRRTNATTREDFYRTWPEYQLGFGSLTGEFWVGLDMLYFLTFSSVQELRIDLADFEGEHRWAKYGLFKVGPAVDNYRLTVSRYTGNAGDGLMEHHSGHQFSTYDADHDQHSTFNCAESWKGGWWYNSCHRSNLNGYQHEGATGTSGEGIIWQPWKGHDYSLMNVTLMIRPTL